MSKRPISSAEQAALARAGIRCHRHPLEMIVAQQVYTVRYGNGTYADSRYLLCEACAAAIDRDEARRRKAHAPKPPKEMSYGQQ